jgi:tellurite resistance protein
MITMLADTPFKAGGDWWAIFLVVYWGWWLWDKFNQPGDFEIRTREVMRGDNNDVRVITIEGRGKLPVNTDANVQFAVFAKDVSEDKDGEAIISTLNNFKLPNSHAFLSTREFGLVRPGQYLKDWSEVGILLPDHVVAPKSGQRTLKFFCAMTPTGNLDVTYVNGECTASYDISQLGYNEFDEKRMEAISLSLDLGVAIAYGDGNLDRSEGQAISDWLRNKLEMFDDETKPKARTQLNEALKASFDKAASGQLTITDSIAKLKASKVRNAVNDALELSSIVMAADGVIAESEMAMLRSFAKELGVNMEDLQNIADKHVGGAKSAATDKSEVSDESLIGIDPKAEKTAIKKALIDAFGKYNARLQTEKDPARRAYFQDMLNAVARLRKKYA